MVTVRNQLNNFPRADALIALTYDFDWEILESLVALDHGRRRGSVVITDKSCFDKKMEILPEPQPPWLCNSYFLNPAFGINGAFHPKVTMTLDAENLLLAMGSYNLTKSGVESNLELTSSAKIPLTEPNLDILQSVADFLTLTSEHVSGAAKDIIQEFASSILEVSHGTTKYTSGLFFHSFNKPILTQVLEKIPSIEYMIVLAPTHSSNPQFLREITDLVGKNITFLIDPFRFSVGKEAKTIYEKFQAKKLNCKPHRNLHAKLYVFETKAGDWVLYGSPNFTENALLLEPKNGGNVETAYLIPPTPNWSWQQLFESSVTLSGINLTELPASEETETNPTIPAIVERWGYETLDGKGIILASGLKDNTIVYVHLCGTAEKIEVLVVNGKIVFEIPPHWKGTKYEVIDYNGHMLTYGIINRVRIVVSGYEERNFDEDTLRELYRFMRRLQQNVTFYGKKGEINQSGLDIVIVDENLRPRPPQRDWNPYSGNFKDTKPDQFYIDTKKKLLKTVEYLLQGHANLRQLMSNLDLALESTFYAGLLTGSRALYQVQVANDFSQWMNLPSGNDTQVLTMNDLDSWHPHLFEPMNGCSIEEWKKNAPKSGIDVSLLFDYWIYFHSVGRHAFERCRLDAVIVTNRYYQIWLAFKKLSAERTVKASIERIIESRLRVLESTEIQKLGEIPCPTNLTDLENCLQSAFERCRPTLKPRQPLF
jgi:hypothetical protein